MAAGSTLPALVAYRAQLPAYRQRRGRRHPLLALVLLVCVAMLCGARRPAASADWGGVHGQPWLRRLGLTRPRGPRQATRSRGFRAVPRATVEAALGRGAEQVLRRCPPTQATALAGVAGDGQWRRGRAKHGAIDAHLLSACSHRLNVVLGQVGGPDTTNEIGAADDLVRSLVLAGRVVTAAARLTPHEIAQTLVASRGDYLLVGKEQQEQ